MINGSYHLAAYGIYQMETDDFCPAHVLFITVREMTWEENLATGIVACLLLGIDILKLHEHILIVLKTIFL